MLITLVTSHLTWRLQHGHTTHLCTCTNLLLQQYQLVWSSCSDLLALPSTISKYGRHAFSYVTTPVWNDPYISHLSSILISSYHAKILLISSMLKCIVLWQPANRLRLKFRPQCLTVVHKTAHHKHMHVCTGMCIYIDIYIQLFYYHYNANLH